MDTVTMDEAVVATTPPSATNVTPGAAASPELSIIVPCYKERPNVRPMVERVAAALPGVAWEIIFVDDNSPDGTAEAARAIAQLDPRVRCIRRIGRRGLSSAVIEGALSSSADFVAVMDGDLQHDQTVLPAMLVQLRANAADIVIGSRHVVGGSSDGLSSAMRHRISNAGISVAQHVLPMRVTDPMSGFFMMPRARFEVDRTAPFGPGIQNPARSHSFGANEAAGAGNSLPVSSPRSGRKQARCVGDDPVRGVAAG